MSLMKIFVAAPIKKGSVVDADVIVKSQNQIQPMSRYLINKTLSVAKPMAALKSMALKEMALKKMAMSRTW